MVNSSIVRLIYASWLVWAVVVLVSARASAQCSSFPVTESYPSLVVKGADIFGQNDEDGTKNYESRACAPEPIVLYVDTCDPDEFSFVCCEPDGTQHITRYLVCENTQIGWQTSHDSGPTGDLGYFVTTDGSMLETISIAGDDWAGNNAVVFHPPYDIAPGEQRTLRLQFFVSDTDSEPGNRDDVDCDDGTSFGTGGTGGLSGPPPLVLLEFGVQVIREHDFTFRVLAAAPVIPEVGLKCDLNPGVNVYCPGSPVPDDCDCDILVTALEDEPLELQVVGAVEMCEWTFRPMDVVRIADIDKASYSCIGTCPEPTTEIEFSDTVSVRFSNSTPDLGGFAAERRYGEAVFHAYQPGVAELDAEASNAHYPWCDDNPPLGVNEIDSAIVNVTIYPTIELSWADSAGDCQPGQLLDERFEREPTSVQYATGELTVAWDDDVPPDYEWKIKAVPDDVQFLGRDGQPISGGTRSDLPMTIEVLAKTKDYPDLPFAENWSGHPITISVTGTTANEKFLCEVFESATIMTVDIDEVHPLPFRGYDEYTEEAVVEGGGRERYEPHVIHHSVALGEFEEVDLQHPNRHGSAIKITSDDESVFTVTPGEATDDAWTTRLLLGGQSESTYLGNNKFASTSMWVHGGSHPIDEDGVLLARMSVTAYREVSVSARIVYVTDYLNGDPSTPADPPRDVGDEGAVIDAVSDTLWQAIVGVYGPLHVLNVCHDWDRNDDDLCDYDTEMVHVLHSVESSFAGTTIYILGAKSYEQPDKILGDARIGDRNSIAIYADAIEAIGAESGNAAAYDALISTIAHEIGHTLGLSHIEDEGEEGDGYENLMAKRPQVATRLRKWQWDKIHARGR